MAGRAVSSAERGVRITDMDSDFRSRGRLRNGQKSEERYKGERLQIGFKLEGAEASLPSVETQTHFLAQVGRSLQSVISQSFRPAGFAFEHRLYGAV